MPIYIYNSLTRKKEEFIPLKPPEVNMYTCGVTVYDESHIGHARSLYIFDVIRRYFEYRKFKVNFARNLTDIDDKIINRANELKVDWQELVDKYIKSYYEDLKSLGISKGDFEPRATENIAEMIKYISGLIEKGYAYESGGDVYFSVRKFAGYGSLSGQSVDEMQKGVRIDPNDLKKDALDFALWKSSKEFEPFWESPWGRGRPGWHIECSVMSQKFLKTNTLDIHAGGRDLIFPHHENEIAQAEAFTGKPFAKYWLHHGLLTINGQKMSKSLGNFVTIKDFMFKYNNPDLLKLFFLSAHYAHPVDYTDSKIEEAHQALERIVIFIDKTKNLKPSAAFKNNPKELAIFKEKFILSMDDDFNSPGALAAIFECLSFANKNIDNPDIALSASMLIKELLNLLGITLKLNKANEILSEEDIKLQVDRRIAAKRAKDYALADKIRVELEVKEVIIEDLKDGSTVWRRRL
ncbi:MAG: cysteine--tRNA ligase [Candidatus Omnitrophica bacterium]|nr:cysteine--tRNA ligase [Candidatus Omnitrophota bacterium]